MTAFKTAAAYIRVSTTDQLEYSPESQLRLIKEYAKKNKITIFEEHIYKDEGISGRTAEKRPAFQRMIAAAKQKPAPFDCILIYSTSRFARNHEQSVVYRSMLEKECDIELISITQPNVDKKTDMLTSAIYSIMDEWYSLDLSENVKRGMAQKAMAGGYQTAAPFGYERKFPKAPLSIVPEESEVVRYIFESYVNGISKWSIARQLDSKGFKGKRGGKFSTRNVDYILQNPVYIGYARWTPDGKERTWKFDDEKTLIVKSDHEAIIEEALFNKVQQKIKESYNKSSKKQKQPAETTAHWLSGLLKCDVCGRSLNYNGVSKTKKYPSFRCGGYNKGTCKTMNFITQSEAEKLVLEYFEGLNSGVTLAYDVNVSKSKVERIDFKLLAAQKKKIEARLVRAKQGYLDGIFELEEYKEVKTKGEEELLKIRKQLDNTLTGNINYGAFYKNIHNTYDILTNPTFSKDEKQAAIRSVVDSIVVGKKSGKFDIYFLQL